MTMAGEPALTIHVAMPEPRNVVSQARRLMTMIAFAGVRYLGWSLPNMAGIIRARAMENMRREAPIRNAFQEVRIPATPPAMTTVPQNSWPNRMDSASAVTRSWLGRSADGIAMAEVKMMSRYQAMAMRTENTTR